MTYEYELIRSKRRSISLGINKELKIIVRAPLKMAARDIEAFVEKHSLWIEKNMTAAEKRALKHLTAEEAEALRRAAGEVLPGRVAYYSGVMGVQPLGVKITSAQTRWGSCSAKNGLCFSYRLMLLPPELIDYIVVHELAHIRVKNHSASFYNEVARYMPDYKSRVARIKKY